MREIKYRQIKDGKTHYWGFIKKMGFVSPMQTSEWHDVPSCEFTGLHDKNGKEIYEGDILKLDSWAGVQQVRFIEGAFCLANEKGMFVGDIRYIQHGNIKQSIIIGNIYENSDLLPLASEGKGR